MGSGVGLRLAFQLKSVFCSIQARDVCQVQLCHRSSFQLPVSFTIFAATPILHPILCRITGPASAVSCDEKQMFVHSHYERSREFRVSKGKCKLQKLSFKCSNSKLAFLNLKLDFLNSKLGFLYWKLDFRTLNLVLLDY